ncbi:MAG: LysR family transcriptional regulator [Enhygromyxa sp.]
MNADGLDLNDLYYFAKVVEHGGFAPASRAIGVPKSKLSRRVADLEERLGVRLIQRSSRQFVVTEVGQTYLEHCRAMLIEAEAAQASIDAVKAEPRGTVRLTCPTTLLHVHVGAMLAEFMNRYPKITVHLDATNRRVDVLAEGVDLAIRVRPAPFDDSELALRVLSDRGQRIVGSPDFLERHGVPATPEELSSRPSLARGSSQGAHAWTLHGPDDQTISVRHQPRLVTTDMVALRTAALAGVGLVQLPLLMIRDQLAAGELVAVLPDWRPRREIIHVVFPSRRGLVPSVRCLIDHLVESYASFDEE